MSSTITKEELIAVQADPMRAVSLMINKIEQASSDVMIVDPSNPFSFMMETIAFNCAVLRDEINTKHARIHAKLANSESSLYNNMSYLDFKNIFSTPADSVIRFEVNVTNFNNNALVSPSGDFKMVSIPEGSTISVEGYEFLIANRIDIKQFTNGLFSVEQNISNSGIGVSSLGILPHALIKSSDENYMLVFDTVLKQVTHIENIYTIKKTDSFKMEIPITDKLYFISATTSTTGTSIPVKVAYSEVIDPATPTIIAKVLSSSIEITVPDVYIINELMLSKLNISIYTTKGEVDYPLNLLDSKSFAITYKNTTEDVYTSVISKVAIANKAIDRLTGGRDGKTFSEIRESIINNAMGDNSSPATNSQLLALLKNDGFDGYLLKDTVTDRTYVASRALTPVIEANMTNANPDLLMYKAQIIPDDYINHSMILVTDDIDDKLVIKPNTLFKQVSGVVTPLSDAELSALNDMGIANKIAYVNSNKIVYSPYSYISSIKEGVYYVRVIDFKASINSSSIRAINTNILARINTQSYSITVTDTGYKLVFKMISNSEFEKIDITTVRAQLKITMDANNFIYFQANYDNGYFEFNIDSNFYVDEDMNLLITNGVSSLATRYVSLQNEMELITYSLGSDVEINNDMYLNESVLGAESTVVFTTEAIDVILGVSMDRLYKNMTISYTDRKYLTYTEDVYARYDTDIYATDSIGSLLSIEEGGGTVSYNKLHSIGDLILDEENNPIIIHPAGSYVLDSNGNPTIDRINGIIKYLDMLLLEYSYKYTNPDKVYNTLDSILSYTQDLVEYDSIILEETDILFKPFRNNDGVKLKYNNTYKTIYRDITPEVTLYVEKLSTLTEADMIKIKNTVGAVIHSYLNKDSFYTVDIREDIKKILPMDLIAVGVKIDTEDDYLIDAEKVVLHDTTNRLSLSKYVTNILGGLNLVYNIKITIRKL